MLLYFLFFSLVCQTKICKEIATFFFLFSLFFLMIIFLLSFFLLSFFFIFLFFYFSFLNFTLLGCRFFFTFSFQHSSLDSVRQHLGKRCWEIEVEKTPSCSIL